MRGSAPKDKIDAGSIVNSKELTTISGKTISIPNPKYFIHLQFRRFAGCPVCNLHLRNFVKRYNDIVAAGIFEVIIFHSSQEELMPHADNLPFSVIADPHKRLYAEFGVESSIRSVLDPHTWFPIVQSIGRSFGGIIFHGKALPSLNPGGGRYGLPADFLISSNGTVLAKKYGDHAYDQWSVDELLQLVKAYQ